MNYGIGNVKDKSKALFTTKTAPTESGGVITLATTNIVESGFKVGDYLAYVDSDNISALYSISAISSGTATLSLVGNIGGGGKQLYQHNICYKTGGITDIYFVIPIITDNPIPITNGHDLYTLMVEKGYCDTGTHITDYTAIPKGLLMIGRIGGNQVMLAIAATTTVDRVYFYHYTGNGNLDLGRYTLTDNVVAL